METKYKLGEILYSVNPYMEKPEKIKPMRHKITGIKMRDNNSILYIINDGYHYCVGEKYIDTETRPGMPMFFSSKKLAQDYYDSDLYKQNIKEVFKQEIQKHTDEIERFNNDIHSLKGSIASKRKRISECKKRIAQYQKLIKE